MDKKRKIIVAEDDQDLLWMMVELLRNEGYEVLGLPDGVSILEDHCQMPDLFILDKELDFVDGVAITLHLKVRPQSKNIPIVMISGAEHERSARAAGVDAYFVKPFHANDLVETVGRLLAKEAVMSEATSR